MTQNYTLNNELNRLEPLDKNCGFCDSGKMEDVNDCHFVSLFSEQDRTNIIVYRSVEYSKFQIGIPRCHFCLGIHQSAHKLSSKICWFLAVGIAIGIGIYVFTKPDYDFFDMFFGCMAALILVIGVGLGGSEVLKNIMIRKKGICTLIEGTEANEAVQDFVIKGWSLTHPRA